VELLQYIGENVSNFDYTQNPSSVVFKFQLIFQRLASMLLWGFFY